MLLRSTLRAIVDGRQSAHPKIPAVLEERAMPMIAHILTSLQTLPGIVFIFFIFRFVLATLSILVFIFLEQMHGGWSLILHVPHLLFSDVFPFAFLGPIMGTGPLLLIATLQWSYHIDVKREIQSASRRPFTCIPVTLYHVNAWEGPSINFHGELSQDQLALLNSRLNLSMELFAVIGGLGE
jgi:hypothetical protein